MATKPDTPARYLASLPPERKAVVGKMRRAIAKNLPKGFEETIGYGMLAWVVPHRLFPNGYHVDPTKPLPFINLASQKGHVALYHMGLYAGPLLPWLKAEWPKHTKAKLDMGKGCVRFRRLDDVPYDLIGELASKMTPDQWIAAYRAARARG
ncbi:MAG: hypothetical protein A2138_12505 [Deltaproteobacteria bacterium RBG_16_71_12]|nr:MAG: hypothetical protein A2138_12505 [Deltaproteobacteria bacterium RBG_16_71_12]